MYCNTHGKSSEFDLLLIMIVLKWLSTALREIITRFIRYVCLVYWYMGLSRLVSRKSRFRSHTTADRKYIRVLAVQRSQAQTLCDSASILQRARIRV